MSASDAVCRTLGQMPGLLKAVQYANRFVDGPGELQEQRTGSRLIREGRVM